MSKVNDFLVGEVGFEHPTRRPSLVFRVSTRPICIRIIRLMLVRARCGFGAIPVAWRLRRRAVTPTHLLGRPPPPMHDGRGIRRGW